MKVLSEVMQSHDHILFMKCQTTENEAGHSQSLNVFGCP